MGHSEIDLGKETEQGGVQKILSQFTGVLAIVTGLFFVVNCSQLLEFLGIFIPLRTIRAGFIMVLLILCFLRPKKGKPVGRLWLNILFAVGALVSFGYYAFFPNHIEELIGQVGSAGTFEIIMCFVAVIVMLEAVRRRMGTSMALIAALFFIYPLFANYLPGIFYGKAFSLPRLAFQIYLADSGIFGPLTHIAVTLVLIFIMFGEFLTVSGAGDWFLNLALSFLGHMTGGPAKAAVVGSCLFGSISGSPAANVATTGSLTIPLMKRTGYDPAFAGGVETAASTGGLIMPPVMGAIAFLMAQWLGIRYWDVCVAAIVPALLYYAAIYIMVHQEARRLKLRVIPKSELLPITEVIKEGWYWVLAIVCLIVLLGAFDFAAERAGFWSLMFVIFLSMFRKKTRITPRRAMEGLKGGMMGCIVPSLAIATVGIIVGSLYLTGLGLKVTSSMVDIAGGSTIALLLMAAVVCFILGMGMSALPAYVMVVTFVAPALLEMGISQLSSHMFVFYFSMISFITPPVAIAAFVAAGIADANPMKVGFNATRLAVICYIVPFAFVYHPELLMQGSLQEIIVRIVISAVSMGIITIGAIGYLWRGEVKWYSRLVLLICGGTIMVSSGTFLSVSLILSLLVLALETLPLMVQRNVKQPVTK